MGSSGPPSAEDEDFVVMDVEDNNEEIAKRIWP